MSVAVEGDARIAEVLEAAAEFYSAYLWTTEIGEAIRARIAREGIREEAIRRFGVGYVPGRHGLLEANLAAKGFSPQDLYDAGIASRSRRGNVHSHFRSRIMFPIRDPAGAMLGFAGMATNPGPSWPLWLISPDRAGFDKRRAIFALDRAAEAIKNARRTVVYRDCLDVLRSHQEHRCEAVALIRSSMTRDHIAQIAAALDLPAAALVVDRDEDSNATVIREAREGDRAGSGLEPLGSAAPAEERLRESDSEIRPDPIKRRTPAQRLLLQLARVAVGIGIPVVWLALMQPDLGVSGGADPALVGANAGVAGTYLLLTIVSSVGAARVRARSRARRMRGAWAMGATEWQPLAWTYHMLEEILFAAALVSAAVCVVLWVAVGGFT